MKSWRVCVGLSFLVFGLTSAASPADHALSFFLAKASEKEEQLSATEKTELLGQIQTLLARAGQIRKRLVQSVLEGDQEMKYQEGRLWMSKLEDDLRSIETATQQVKLLSENVDLILPSVKLYKSLRDLSANFLAYMNVPAFSPLAGDLGLEIELWADPVFSKLHLIPLAELKDSKRELPQPPPAPPPEIKPPPAPTPKEKRAPKSKK